MDQYLYQEWTEETYQKVADAIASLVSNPTILKMLIDKTRDDKMKQLLTDKMSVSTASSSASKSKASELDDDINFESDPFVEEKTETVAETTSSEADDYDSLFSDL